jgi:hypothetical protein
MVIKKEWEDHVQGYVPKEAFDPGKFLNTAPSDESLKLFIRAYLFANNIE